MFQWLRQKTTKQRTTCQCGALHFTLSAEEIQRMAESALRNVQTLIEEIGTTSEGVGLRIEQTGLNAKTGFPTYNLCGPKALLDKAYAKMKSRDGFSAQT